MVSKINICTWQALNNTFSVGSWWYRTSYWIMTLILQHWHLLNWVESTELSWIMTLLSSVAPYLQLKLTLLLINFGTLTELLNWINTSQRPAPLCNCCYVRQAKALSQWKIHRGAKRKLTTCLHTTQSRLLLVWNKVSAFKFCPFLRNSNNKYNFVPLMCHDRLL